MTCEPVSEKFEVFGCHCRRIECNSSTEILEAFREAR